MKCYSLSLEFILLHVFTTRYIVEMRIVDDYFFLRCSLRFLFLKTGIFMSQLFEMKSLGQDFSE